MMITSHIFSTFPSDTETFELIYVKLCYVYVFGICIHTFALLDSAKARQSNIIKLSDNLVMDLFLSSSTITSTDLMGFSRLTIMMK